MDLGYQCLWIGFLLQTAVLPSCHSVSVRFLNQQPFYVVSGQNLVLQAELQIPQGDRVTKVLWEHQPEGKTNSGRTKVAEYPDMNSGGRVSVEKNGAVIKLWNFQRSDSGLYTITVRDQRGGKDSAQCTVHEYEAVHHVSVMVNVSHSTLHCAEAWGSEPVYSWLHEKAAVTEELGQVSANGTLLNLNADLCGHFTCVVSNKLGHSSATYSAEPCKRESDGTAATVVCVMFLIMSAGGLAFLFWRRRHRCSIRRMRLHDSQEETI